MALPDLPPVNPLDVPKDPEECRPWILVQLRRRGISLRRLSLRDGYSGNYYGQCLYRPLFPGEQALSKAFGLKPMRLFPERFDRRGNRLHLVRSKHSPAADGCNVKGSTAA